MVRDADLSLPIGNKPLPLRGKSNPSHFQAIFFNKLVTVLIVETSAMLQRISRGPYTVQGFLHFNATNGA